MKIKILSTCFAGAKLLEAGKTVDVDEKVANDLIKLRRADSAEKKKKGGK